MSEYTEKADQFLAKSGIEFRAVLVGSDCPTFCEDAAAERDMDKVDTFPRRTHIHGKHYRCTFSAKGRGHLSIDFWNSYADEEQNYYCSRGRNMPALTADYRMAAKYKGKKPAGSPTAYDVLASVQKSDVGTFHDFCGGFGYDEDSRKAEQTYQAVCKEYQKTQKFFTSAELEEMQDIS